MTKEDVMKVLIVGSGGREHAIAASVAKSPRADKIYCAPGNAGIAEYAECVDIGAMEFDKLAAFAKEKEIDLCIVGMDDPLVGGLVDVLEEAGIRTFGPRKNAAILEGSKAFSKDLMKKYGYSVNRLRSQVEVVTLTADELDDDTLIVTLEDSPTYNRDIRKINQLRRGGGFDAPEMNTSFTSTNTNTTHKKPDNNSNSVISFR